MVIFQPWPIRRREKPLGPEAQMIADAEQPARIGLRSGGREADVETLERRECECHSQAAEEMAAIDERRGGCFVTLSWTFGEAGVDGSDVHSFTACCPDSVFGLGCRPAKVCVVGLSAPILMVCLLVE